MHANPNGNVDVSDIEEELLHTAALDSLLPFRPQWPRIRGPSRGERRRRDRQRFRQLLR